MRILFAVICLVFLWSESSQAMNPFRKAFVFFAVHRDSTVIAVQSNPLEITDESPSNDTTLIFDGAFTMSGGEGTPVSGFVWENGTSYGGVSAEGQLHAVAVPEEYWASNANLYARFSLLDADDASFLNAWDTPIFLRTIEHLNFFFFQNGTSEPQTIPGDLPSSVPDYNFTGFNWTATPWGNLAGASVSFAHTDFGRTAELQISGIPLGSWSQDDAQCDMVTSDGCCPSSCSSADDIDC